MSAQPAWWVLFRGSLEERSVVACDGMPVEIGSAWATGTCVVPLDPTTTASTIAANPATKSRTFIARFSFGWRSPTNYSKGLAQRRTTSPVPLIGGLGRRIEASERLRPQT